MKNSMVPICYASYFVILFPHAPIARQPLGGLGRLISRGFTITHFLDTPHSVGILCTRDQLVTETSTWQHTTLTRHRHPCPRWDSNPNLSKRAAADPRLRQHGHWDRLFILLVLYKSHVVWHRFVMCDLSIAWIPITFMENIYLSAWYLISEYIPQCLQVPKFRGP
jgi:hypothetical protein